MRTFLVIFITTLIALLLFTSAASAAPGLCITKPPILGPPNTGPLIDPAAKEGQWFTPVFLPIVQNRKFEFYDNVDPYGGGWMGSLAIQGYIVRIEYDAIDNITGFWMEVTITNDMPGMTEWAYGMNSHDEYRLFVSMDDQIQYIPMLNVKWTASFADDGTLGNFPLVGYPYIPAQPPFNLPLTPESNIYAMPFEEGGYDELAWYCWTPDPDAPSHYDGQFMVPTWDFGDIMPGQSATRLIHFYLYMPVGAIDPSFQFLQDAHTYQWDMLSNRTSSLKISQYFDGLFPDSGVPYPEQPISASDCSVFFSVEEPVAPVVDDVYRDHPNGSLIIQWYGTWPWIYTIESSTTPYDPDYNENNMIWNFEASGMGMTSWVDLNPPPFCGPEKYYRIYVQHPCGGMIYGPDTVGAMVVICNVGRNMVSSPFEPYPDGGLSGGGPMGSASLDKIVGNQLTGHNFNRNLSDNIEIWVNTLAAYQRAWYRTSLSPTWLDWSGGTPLFGIDSDRGYWFNILATHPAKRFVFCGRVSKVDRGIQINVGRNLVGSCFPVKCPLMQSNLVGSGLTGHAFNRNLSDNVEFWNNPLGTYQRFWYDTLPGPGSWLPWNAGDPMRDIVPGDAIWVNVLLGHTPFTWTYLVPPRPPVAP